MVEGVRELMGRKVCLGERAHQIMVSIGMRRGF